MNDIKELKDEELNKATGGQRIEPIDGMYHFKKYMVFVTNIDTSIVDTILYKKKKMP